MSIYFGREGRLFYNATLGMFSLRRDNGEWITIADKNVGATQVWNDGDVKTSANCGYFFQWGNNYGFPITGATTTSFDPINASSYGPSNPYSSNVFICSWEWDSSRNNSLWGYSGTVSDKQGPCNQGRHIGTSQEYAYIQAVYTNIYDLSTNQSLQAFFKMPNAGSLSYSDGNHTGGSDQSSWSYGYWTCVPGSSYYRDEAEYLRYSLSDWHTTRSFAFPIRPIKDVPEIPDGSWTCIY